MVPFHFRGFPLWQEFCIKITLVRAATSIGANEIRSGAAAPLGLAYLAGNLLAAGYDVWAVDAVGESLSQYAAVPEAPGIMRHGLTDEQVVERMKNHYRLKLMSRRREF